MMDTTKNSQNRVFLAQAVYTKSVLYHYDTLVGLNARFFWQCSWDKLLCLYNENISENHLEVGTGTGYFLDNCRFPVDKPRIALLDLNPNCLEFTSKRIQRYNPTTYQANVLEAIPISDKYNSVGLNYVLHCIPGTIPDKAVVFKNLKSLMNEGGTLFGSTILGEGVKHNYLGHIVMKNFNKSGTFNNLLDNISDLKDALEKNFSNSSIQLIGCTALFTARK
jgi:ubiquinone/menaquinone biosynthesis C-methylase UbiE